MLVALLLAPGSFALAQSWSAEISPRQQAPAPPVRKSAPPAASARPAVDATNAKLGAPRPKRARATAAHVEADSGRTRFSLEVSAPVAANIYALSEPYRVVADLPDVDFVLPVGAGRHASGLVSGFRFGLVDAGRARLVIDVSGPVAIEGARFVQGPGGGGRLVFELVAISEQTFAALEAEARKQNGLRQSRYDDTGPVQPPGAKARPVVLIDPGHGGPDPGTVAGPRLSEKDVVLAVARQLRALLLANRRYDVHMTRDSDVFVSLDGRLRLSRRLGADLFISLHIDAMGEAGFAQSVRGASIYVLSEKASDEAARQLADKENASDVLAGLENVPSSDEDNVRAILIDLIRRETAGASADFRNILTGKLRDRIAIAREPQRAAAFKVLKQAETPSVLVELGYMSHPEDRALIAKPEWQRQVATSIAEAVDIYFSRHEAAARP